MPRCGTICEQRALATQLLAKHPVVLLRILDDALLTTIHPSAKIEIRNSSCRPYGEDCTPVAVPIASAMPASELPQWPAFRAS